MTHHPDCLAQNAATLFGEAGPCICPPKWLKAQAKAEKAAKKPKTEPNPCWGADLVPVEVPAEHWQVRLPFTPSTKQLTAYANSHKHRIPTNRELDGDTGDWDYRESFDDEAVRTLRQRYSKDPLYPLLEGYRIYQKAKGTYLDKMRPGSDLVWADGRLHDRFRHSPRTLRLAMELLQVLPRPLSAEDMAHLPADAPERVYDAIRKCFVPAPGHSFIGIDLANVEPQLVAYLAQDAGLFRSCATSSHSWFAANVVGKVVDFAWSDADIAAYFKELSRGTYTIGTGKAARTLGWADIRTACKTALMTSLYIGGPAEIAKRNPIIFPTRTVAAYYQDAFFDLCPQVKLWHWSTAETVERQGYLVTPLGHRLYYGETFTYAKDQTTGQWQRTLSREAKAAAAGMPQAIGMMYLATAVVELARQRPEWVDWLRLLIHDEVLSEVPDQIITEFVIILSRLMSTPHPLMPLDWLGAEEQARCGTHLSVRCEVKRSAVSWGDMA